MDPALIEKYQTDDPLLLVFNQVIFGLDYRLNARPENARGEPLFRPEEKGYYDIYLDWLADYLYGRRIEPNRKQRDLCRIVSGLSKEHAMRLLGTYAGVYEFLLIDCDAMVAVSERIKDPGNYTEEDIQWILEDAERSRRASMEDDQEITVVVHREFQARPRENIIQYLEEEAERERLCKYPDYQFGDVGWRIPLSLVLSDVPEKRERIRLLDEFYDWFLEYLHK